MNQICNIVEKLAYTDLLHCVLLNYTVFVLCTNKKFIKITVANN